MKPHILDRKQVSIIAKRTPSRNQKKTKTGMPSQRNRAEKRDLRRKTAYTTCCKETARGQHRETKEVILEIRHKRHQKTGVKDESYAWQSASQSIPREKGQQTIRHHAERMMSARTGKIAMGGLFLSFRRIQESNRQTQTMPAGRVY